MYDTIKKYWNSDEYNLGLEGGPKAKPRTVIIIAIVLLYGYLFLFNGFIYQIDFISHFLSWPDRNIVRDSSLFGINLLVHIGVSFMSMIHFIIIIFQWFKAIKNANKNEKN